MPIGRKNPILHRATLDKAIRLVILSQIHLTPKRLDGSLKMPGPEGQTEIGNPLRCAQITMPVLSCL